MTKEHFITFIQSLSIEELNKFIKDKGKEPKLRNLVVFLKNSN